ncbi:MAG: hypothetical protein ACRCZF_25265, partial [Gemmataceae bacterium]
MRFPRTNVLHRSDRPQTSRTLLQFLALESRTNPSPMGVNVAAGDVNGDGYVDLTVGSVDAAGPMARTYSGLDGTILNDFSAPDGVGGTKTSVAVAPATFQRRGYVTTASGETGLIGIWSENQRVPTADSYVPYGVNSTGGASIAVGAFTGDSTPDVVSGAGFGGGPRVRIFDGLTNQPGRDFFAYDARFRGGVNVAAADITGDGTADILTGAGPGGGPHVRVFDGRSGGLVRDFFAYDNRFRGGVSVAGGDVTGDGVSDIITGAGPGGGPHVRVYDGKTGLIAQDFYAYTAEFTGGVNVAAADVNRDGFSEIITGAASGSTHVRVIDGRTGKDLASFFGFDKLSNGFAKLGQPVTLPGIIADNVPTISPIGGIAVVAGEKASTATFTVYDIETAAEQLVVTAKSSDSRLIPANQVSIVGNGVMRTVTVA